MTESFGILSTYPPTQCGLATFAASLAAALAADPDPVVVGVVEVTEHPFAPTAPGVAHRWVRDRPGGESAVAAELNRHDVAILQHEYGIFDGEDGDSVVTVLDQVRVPVITVLHTVQAEPTDNQRRILERVVGRSSQAVVMTETARSRLVADYDVDATKIHLIPHGAPTDWGTGGPTPGPPAGDGPTSRVPTLLTWGLLGPGKGIEWVVEAMAHLDDLRPPPRYVVAGETHPHVLEAEGEAYRDALLARAARHGLSSRVQFDNRYLERPDLRRLIAGADVVVLPYDSTDQVTSGVLIEAVIARRPIVATAFPHALELLAGGAGTVVAQGDAPAIARAVRRILTEPGVAQSMVAVSERLVPDLTWAAVAGRYRALARTLLTGLSEASA